MDETRAYGVPPGFTHLLLGQRIECTSDRVSSERVGVRPHLCQPVSRDRHSDLHEVKCGSTCTASVTEEHAGATARARPVGHLDTARDRVPAGAAVVTALHAFASVWICLSQAAMSIIRGFGSCEAAV